MTKDQWFKWMEEADAYAEQEFCISAVECNGGDPVDEYDMLNYSPEDWVEYKAEKYDLIRRDRWEQLHGTSRVRITTYEPVVERFEREGDEY